MQILALNHCQIALALTTLTVLELANPISANTVPIHPKSIINANAQTQTFSSRTLVLAANTTTPPCQASSFTGNASGWSLTAQTLGGNFILVNKSSKVCSLNVFVRIQLLDAQGRVLPVNHYSTTGFSGTPIKSNYLLKPKEVIGALVVWDNWCSAKPKGGLRLKITLPANQGQLTIPIIYSKGTPLDSTPSCVDSKHSSVLQLQYLPPKP